MQNYGSYIASVLGEKFKELDYIKYIDENYNTESTSDFIKKIYKSIQIDDNCSSYISIENKLNNPNCSVQQEITKIRITNPYKLVPHLNGINNKLDTRSGPLSKELIDKPEDKLLCEIGKTGEGKLNINSL